MKQLVVITMCFIVSACGISKTVDPVTGERQAVSLQALAMSEQAASGCLVQASAMQRASESNLATLIANDKYSQTTLALLTQSWMFLNQRAVSNQITACTSQVDTVAKLYNLTDQQRIESGQRIVRTAIAAGATVWVAGQITGFLAGAVATRPVYNINGSGRQVNINDLPSTVDSGVTANVLSGDQTTTEVPGQGGTPSTISNSGEQGSQNGVTNFVNISPSGDGGGNASLSIGTSSNDPIEGEGAGVTGSGTFAPENPGQ